MSDLTINEKEIGLWRLETELAELMQVREDEALDTEEKIAINAQIKAYVAAELRKVDNVASFIRYRRSGAAEARAEAKRLERLADSWERDEEYLLGLVIDLMIEFKETKLEGRYGYLKLQANGGVQPLDIYNKELIPEEMVEYTVRRLSSEVWSRILKECHLVVSSADVERVPKASLIRETLARECPKCCGNGQCIVYHQSMDEGGHVTERGYDEKCPECGGLGRTSVPGARLEPRGQHVRIK